MHHVPLSLSWDMIPLSYTEHYKNCLVAHRHWFAKPREQKRTLSDQVLLYGIFHRPVCLLLQTNWKERSTSSMHYILEVPGNIRRLSHALNSVHPGFFFSRFLRPRFFFLP